MILILGVTASGKGRLAFDLANRIGGEIISVDSMKVYRRMDIGTAKPSKEARERVPCHLIDVVEPSEPFSVADFLALANEAIRTITRKGKRIIAVGGTALYIKSLLYGLFEGPGADPQIRTQLKALADTEGLQKLWDELNTIDPAAAARISANDARRIIRALEVYRLTGKPISHFQRQWNAEEPAAEWTIIGLRREKTQESRHMNARVKRMIEAGLVDEVRRLLAEPRPLSEQARCAIGYAEIINHLSGKTTLDEAIELIKKNTRKLAKSQRTWFKTFRSVRWLDVAEDETSESILGRALNIV